MKVLICGSEIAALECVCVCCTGLYFREGFVQYPVGLKEDERKGSAGDKRGGHTRPFWLERPYPAAMSSDCHTHTHTHTHLHTQHICHISMPLQTSRSLNTTPVCRTYIFFACLIKPVLANSPVVLGKL